MALDTINNIINKANDWPRIAEFFKGHNVFITGGTGFMGKVLIEKLLYSCPDIGKIYIIIRPKHGKDGYARINEMFKLPLFVRVRNERPNSHLKIVPISGDLSEDNLGISKENRELLQHNCSIIFHMGATVKFDEPLKNVILQNTQATAYMIELAKGMKNLIAFVYLSTAFSHVEQLILEEKTYKPLHEPNEILKLLKTISTTEFNDMAANIVPPHPNNYCFSKHLSEALIERASKDIPMVIARPSIVIATWKEPIPGWVDNLNGPTGIIAGAGKGVIRSVQCNKEYRVEAAPVDLAINSVIVATWRRALDKNKEIQVYNITNGGKLPLTWGEVMDKGRKYIYEYPFENVVWYPDGDIRSSRFQHNLIVLFFHFLPALLIDFLLFICGQKRFMMRIQKRITDGSNLIQYFTTRDWLFKNENYNNLKNLMHPTDFKVFYTDGDVDLHEYFKNLVLGTRQYCLKEDLSTLPASRRHITRLYWIQKTFWVLVYSTLIYYTFNWIQPTIGISYTNTSFG